MDEELFNRRVHIGGKFDYPEGAVGPVFIILKI